MSISFYVPIFFNVSIYFFLCVHIFYASILVAALLSVAVSHKMENQMIYPLPLSHDVFAHRLKTSLKVSFVILLTSASGSETSLVLNTFIIVKCSIGSLKARPEFVGF